METNYFPFTSWSVPIERLFILRENGLPDILATIKLHAAASLQGGR
jgi:hypothetical protein